jgi:hypothetical protein
LRVEDVAHPIRLDPEHRAGIEAGTVNSNCVSVSDVSALKFPPSAVAIVPSWLVLRFGVPRNIMCSCACAIPWKFGGSSREPTRYVDVRRDDRRERVAHDDDAQAVVALSVALSTSSGTRNVIRRYRSSRLKSPIGIAASV